MTIDTLVDDFKERLMDVDKSIKDNKERDFLETKERYSAHLMMVLEMRRRIANILKLANILFSIESLEGDLGYEWVSHIDSNGERKLGLIYTKKGYVGIGYCFNEDEYDSDNCFFTDGCHVFYRINGEDFPYYPMYSDDNENTNSHFELVIGFLARFEEEFSDFEKDFYESVGDFLVKREK